MKRFLRQHRFVKRMLWALLAVSALEGAMLFYYLDTWITLPTL